MKKPSKNPKKNIEGYIDPFGIFRPIRKGNKEQGRLYDGELAGDNDDIFDKMIRREKNEKKAEEIYNKRMLDDALESALGEERKVSLSQFVRRSGGLFYNEKEKTNDSGELKQLSFKQSGVRGLAHPKGKKSLDQMREAADLAGYSSKDGLPLSSVNDFLDALDADINGSKIYPFGTVGAYKFNPSNSYYKAVSQSLKRVIEKLKKYKFVAKAKKLEKAFLIAVGLSKPMKTTEKVKSNPAKTKKRKTAKAKAKPRKNLKKNLGIETLATLAVGASAALNVYDRIKKGQKTDVQTTNKLIDLKHNKASNPALHQREFERLLDAIEKGDLSKQRSAKLQGKLAGFNENEISRAIQYARLTYKLKNNPSPAILKEADTAILKINGFFGRALSRHKAGRAYKRQLRLESAIARAKKKRSKYESKAKRNTASPKPAITAVKENPVSSKAFEAFQGRKPTKVLELETPETAPKNLYTIGKLLELRLKGKPNINFRREVTGKTFYVCADEQNKQLWIAGGKIATPNNSIEKGFSEPYAIISHIVYETQKVHLDDKKPTGYIHKFGEEGGEQPQLAFDRDGMGIFLGGDYTITPLGIAD